MTTWFNGFETLDLTLWGGLGPTSINLTSPRSGNACGKTSGPSGGGGAWFIVIDNLGNTISFGFPASIRFAVRVELLPVSGTEEICTFAGLTLRIDQTAVISLWGGSLLATGTTVLTVNAWYVVEMYVTTTTAKVRIYADGHAPPTTDEFSVTVASSGTFQVFLGKANNRNGNAITCSFDDVFVKDGVSGYIGNGRHQLVLGIANPPTYDSWTKSTSSSIDTVWNNIPSGGGNANSSSTGIAKQTIRHNNIFALGSVVINGVKTALVGQGGGGAPTVSMVHIVGGVETDVPFSFSVPVDRYFEEIWSTIPTIMDLNGSEVGCARNGNGAANTTYITDCWLMVDAISIAESGGGGGGGGGGTGPHSTQTAVLFVIE